MRNPSKKTNKIFAYKTFQKQEIWKLRYESGKYQYYRHLWVLDPITNEAVKRLPDRDLKSSRQDCRFQFLYADYAYGNRWYDFNYRTLKRHRVK